MLDGIGGYRPTSGSYDPTESGAVDPNNVAALETPKPASAARESVLDIGFGVGSDPQTRLALMVLEFASDRRDMAAKQRDATEATMQQFEQRAVDLMHEKADEIRDAAVQVLACKLVGAGAKIAGTASGEGGYGEADSQIYGAVGGYLDELSKGRLADLDGSIKSAENRASEAERRLDEIKSEREDARDLKNSALDFLRDANATQAETEQALYIRG
jgi:hypothetical protein